MRDELGGQVDVMQPEEGEDLPTVQMTSPDAATQFATEAETNEIGRQALVSCSVSAPWLGGLFEAIAMDAPAVAEISSPWGGCSDTAPNQDADKHAAYSAHVRKSVDRLYPWLWGLFDAAGARIAAAPGSFMFFVPHRPLVAFDIPALAPLTRLTPWAEPGETVH